MAALLALAIVVGAAGCGDDEGVEDGATVRVYVSDPLCASAKVELDRRGGRAGNYEVEAVCLAAAEGVRGVDLATVGANARRATEDSTTVGFIADPDQLARRGSRRIVEAAGIAQIGGYPGWSAMKFILDAIDEGGSSSPRSDVYENVAGR